MQSLMQLVQMAVLARLLSPEDFGLMALVSVAIVFSSLFSDMGLSSAFIQRQDVTPQQRSSLFWLNIAMATALTVLMVAISPLAAWYFDDDRLLPLFALTATTLIINAAGQQVRIAAEKTLHFRPVVLVDTCSTALGFAATVLAALAGWGVYSLAFGSVLGAISGTVLAWLFIANSWRPQFGFKAEDIRPFIGFGGSLVANNIVNQFNASVDLLIGGRMLAASQLGLYSVPRNLVLQLQFLVNPIITRVAFPMISQVQTDLPRVKAIYLQTVSMTASTNAPLYLGAFFFAQEIVNLLLGSNWTGSVEHPPHPRDLGIHEINGQSCWQPVIGNGPGGSRVEMERSNASRHTPLALDRLAPWCRRHRLDTARLFLGHVRAGLVFSCSPTLPSGAARVCKGRPRAARHSTIGDPSCILWGDLV